MIAALLAAASALLAVLYFAFDAACYRTVRRLVARGDIVQRPFGRMHPFAVTSIGANPDTTGCYVAYTLQPGQRAQLRWRPPDARYWSITLYDRFLQSVDPDNAPTHHNHRTLAPDDDGMIRLILAAAPHPAPGLDTTARPERLPRHPRAGGRLRARHPAPAPSPHPPADMIPPSLPTARPLGHLRSALTDPLPMFARARAIGGVVRLRFAWAHMVTVTDPDAVQQILVEDWESYSKDTNGNHTLSLVLGRGLLTIDHGPQWRRNRRLANPIFHPRRVAGFAEIMARVVRQHGRVDGGVIETSAAMRAMALQIAGETLFSSDVTARSGAIADAIDTALPQMIWFSSMPVRWYPRLPTPGNRRFHAAVAALDEVVTGLIRRRRQRASAPEGLCDLLDLFLSATDADGAQLTDAQLRDELLVMLLAGHETVATALTWTLHLLATHPDAQHRLHEEIAEAGDLGGPADLKRMPFALNVLRESMRLFPPIWLLGRKTVRDVALGGFEIAARTPVTVCAHTLHRHPDLWRDPDRFDPDRWTGSAPPKGAYLPFGAGPRKCIGDRFGELEAMIALVHLVRRFRFSLVDPGPPGIVANITLRPRGGLPLRWTPRPESP